MYMCVYIYMYMYMYVCMHMKQRGSCVGVGDQVDGVWHCSLYLSIDTCSDLHISYIY